MRPIPEATPHGSKSRQLFWRAAWHPLVVVGGVWLLGFAVGNGLTIPGSFVLGRNGLGTQALLSVVGAVCGTLLWVSSVWYVNRRTDGLETELLCLARERFGSGEEQPITITGVGSQRGLVPSDVYRLSTTQVDDDVVVLERLTFDTERWRVTEHPPVSVARERFESVEREGGTFSVRIDDTVWNVEYGDGDDRADGATGIASLPPGSQSSKSA